MRRALYKSLIEPSCRAEVPQMGLTEAVGSKRPKVQRVDACKSVCGRTADNTSLGSPPEPPLCILTASLALWLCEGKGRRWQRSSSFKACPPAGCWAEGCWRGLHSSTTLCKAPWGWHSGTTLAQSNLWLHGMQRHASYAPRSQVRKLNWYCIGACPVRRNRQHGKMGPTKRGLARLRQRGLDGFIVIMGWSTFRSPSGPAVPARPCRPPRSGGPPTPRSKNPPSRLQRLHP